MSKSTKQTSNLPEPTNNIDLRGMRCPLPILRTKKALSYMRSGQILKVITTDLHAEHDFQIFSKQTGHFLLSQKKSGNETTHFLVKK